MVKRLELHQKLVDILGSGNVYFQPPSTLIMKYPAIRYKRSDISNTYAENNVYMQSYHYDLTVIDRDPDSEIVKKISTLPGIKWKQHYTSDNLNHDVFTIYY